MTIRWFVIMVIGQAAVGSGLADLPVFVDVTQQAQIRAEATGLSRYDALLDLYEPGMTTRELDQLFSEVKQWLPGLITQIREKQDTETVIPPVGPFPVEQGAGEEDENR